MLHVRVGNSPPDEQTDKYRQQSKEELADLRSDSELAEPVRHDDRRNQTPTI